MKKFFIILLLVILGVILALIGWQTIHYLRNPDPYKTFLLPRVDMSMIEITSLTSEKTEMNMNVLVSNQLPFSFTADSFQYRFYINDAEIMKSRYKKSVTLEAHDSSWIKLPVTVFNHDIDSVIKANEKRKIDSVEYRMHAEFYTDILFNKEFEVTIKRFLPLIHILKLDMKKVEVDSLNLKRAVMVLHASIINQNVFDIKFSNYSYEVQIEDHEWVKGNGKGLYVIKSNATTDLEIPVTLSLKEVGKTLFDLLRKGKNVNYKMEMKLTIESDQNYLAKSKAIVKSSGTVKSLLKAIKEKD